LHLSDMPEIRLITDTTAGMGSDEVEN
jgi:hypothetical protein